MVEAPAWGQVAWDCWQAIPRHLDHVAPDAFVIMPGAPFWQRNYWEHVVRSERSLNRIREHIENNPPRWAEDQLHPGSPPNWFNPWPSR